MTQNGTNGSNSRTLWSTLFYISIAVTGGALTIVNAQISRELDSINGRLNAVEDVQRRRHETVANITATQTMLTNGLAKIDTKLCDLERLLTKHSLQTRGER